MGLKEGGKLSLGPQEQFRLKSPALFNLLNLPHFIVHQSIARRIINRRTIHGNVQLPFIPLEIRALEDV
jgi:hypothetical protein